MNDQEGTSVRVLQYNTHLFVGTTLGLGPEYEDDLRIGHLITRLNDLGADIVALNEVWADASKDRIIAATRRTYPYAYYRPNDDLTRIGSGLLLLSRHLIASTSYTEFKDLVGWDGMSHKGFYQAVVTVKRASGTYQPVFVFMSHTQSGNGADDAAARKKNLQQIWTAIWNAPFGPNPVLLVGELVGGAPTAEYFSMRSMFQPLGLTDLCRSLHPNARTNPLFSYDTKSNNLAQYFDPESRARERLDYCFVRATGTQQAFAVTTDWRYSDPKTAGFTDLSDHYPLLMSFVV